MTNAGEPSKEGKVGSFAVLARMSETDDNALKFSPMSNIISARKVKHGTQVTIGVGADICLQIVDGSLVGGFIFCDKKRFEEVRAELEKLKLGR